VWSLQLGEGVPLPQEGVQQYTGSEGRRVYWFSGQAQGELE